MKEARTQEEKEKESSFFLVKEKEENDNFLWRKIFGEGKCNLFRTDKPTDGWINGQTDRRKNKVR